MVEVEVRGRLKARIHVAVLEGEVEEENQEAAEEGEKEVAEGGVMEAQRVEVAGDRVSEVVEVEDQTLEEVGVVEAQTLEVEDVVEALISEEVPVVEDVEDLQDRSSSNLALCLQSMLDWRQMTLIGWSTRSKSLK